VREVTAAIAAAPVAGGAAGLRELLALLGDTLATLDAVRRAQQREEGP
jgi:hypothetical protein